MNITDLMNCRVRIVGSWQPKDHPNTWWLLGKIGTVIDYDEEYEWLVVELQRKPGFPALLREDEVVVVGPDEADEEEPEVPDDVFPKWDGKRMRAVR